MFNMKYMSIISGIMAGEDAKKDAEKQIGRLLKSYFINDKKYDKQIVNNFADIVKKIDINNVYEGFKD